MPKLKMYYDSVLHSEKFKELCVIFCKMNIYIVVNNYKFKMNYLVHIHMHVNLWFQKLHGTKNYGIP
jgi:hypothetical protein